VRRPTDKLIIVTSAGLLLAVLALACGCPRTSTGASGPTPRGDALSSTVTAPTGQPIRIYMMPKLKGIDFFNACQKGAEEAATELGSAVEFTYDGPTESKVEKQMEMLDTVVDKGVDVIAVAANDPDAIAPTLKNAKDKGVGVITWDSDANPETSGRTFFVNQATPESIGRTLVDEMAKQAGPRAKFAIISGTATASNQNTWMEYMHKRIRDKHPNMQELAIKYPGEDENNAKKEAQDLLKAYPDINGIFGITSVSFPGAVEAVVNAGKQKEVKVVGLATPKPMKEWVLRGDIESVVLWSCEDLGYLTVQVARAVREGALKPGATEFEAGRLGKVRVDGDQVILGEPLVFTKDNIEKYDF